MQTLDSDVRALHFVSHSESRKRHVHEYLLDTMLEDEQLRMDGRNKRNWRMGVVLAPFLNSDHYPSLFFCVVSFYPTQSQIYQCTKMILNGDVCTRTTWQMCGRQQQLTGGVASLFCFVKCLSVKKTTLSPINDVPALRSSFLNNVDCHHRWIMFTGNLLSNE